MRWTTMLIMLALLVVACGPAPSAGLAPTEAVVAPRATSRVAASATSTSANVDGRDGRFSQPIIVYQREGRFADSPQQWTVHTTGLIESAKGDRIELAPEVMAPLFSLLLSKPFATLDKQYGPVGECRDCVTLTITLYTESLVQEVKVVQGAAEMPPVLQQALEALDVLVGQQP